jgi:16S rRNA (guanine966-N2)-methyltransferase
MSIRITSGKFRGKSIPSPPRSKPIRPTSSLLRESVFNRFSTRLESTRFLDAFAGSGVMSLEALSRGCDFSLLLEMNDRQCRELRKIIQGFGLGEKEAQVVSIDTRLYLSKPCRIEPFDWIFMDPPYGFTELESLVKTTISNGWLKNDGAMIIEHGRRDPDFPGFTRRDYGDSSISIFFNESLPED